MSGRFGPGRSGSSHVRKREPLPGETQVRPGTCRICSSLCPIMVTVENGRAVKVVGDLAAPSFEGYTCPKGRALAEQHNSPQRLLHSMRRLGDGSLTPVSSEQAMDEIAARLQRIIADHGSRAIALYFGTGVMNFFPGVAVAAGFMQSIGSPMMFSATTIDKPGAQIAQAAHGHWLAGHPPFEQAEVWMAIGLNPLISKSGGFPPNNPARRLKDAIKSRAMKLIVIDPRRTDTAQKAHLHLQAKPGQDPVILAAIINQIILDGRCDDAFIAAEVDGLAELKSAVAPFTPELAAERAGIPVEQIIEVGRIFGAARYGGVGCGVGPSFSLTGSLTEYLSTVLMTIRGFWSREGDVVSRPNVLLPAYEARAEAQPPFPFVGQGPCLRIRGLQSSPAGMPTGGLADEILLGGEGQVRALLTLGGNPMMAWPDQVRASAALNSLDLLVCADHEMSATARMADFVIAPKLGLEIPGVSTLLESAKYYGHLRGIEGAYARYTPAVVDPPEGSDVITDWELYYGLAKRMGLPLSLTVRFGVGPHVEAEDLRIELDMTRMPTDDELIELCCQTSQIALDTVKASAHGALFTAAEARVLPKRKGHMGRLDIGNSYMLAELMRCLETPPTARANDKLTLLPRRTNRLMNSAGHNNPRLGGLEPANPAYMHPADMARLGLVSGDGISIASAHGVIAGIAAADPSVMVGHVSMSHGFGLNPDEAEDVVQVGSNVGRLLSSDAEFDAVTGIPRMGALDVTVCRMS